MTDLDESRRLMVGRLHDVNVTAGDGSVSVRGAKEARAGSVTSFLPVLTVPASSAGERSTRPGGRCARPRGGYQCWWFAAPDDRPSGAAGGAAMTVVDEYDRAVVGARPGDTGAPPAIDTHREDPQ